jgi:hypothetical protein
MTSEKIDEMFSQVIAEATKELQHELDCKIQRLEESWDECSQLKQENKELKNILSKYEMAVEVEKLFTEDNFTKMLPFFKLKTNNFSMGGMDFERVPIWFKCLYAHYEDREKLFNLFDLFGIKYPFWAKSFKMPQDYSEKELHMFIDHIDRRYVCNGCCFDGNTGFYWRTVNANNGNNYEILNNKQNADIPWQLVLSNSLWTKEELFDKILRCLRLGHSNSSYFFNIQKYTEISDEQASEMIQQLPLFNVYDIHKEFIKRNMKLIKGNPDFAEKYKKNINDNHYSVFYFLNYPIEYQKEFIRNHKGYEPKFNLIKNMEIPNEEKIKFSMEFLGEDI